MSKRLANFLHNLAIFSHGLVYVGVLVYEAYVVDWYVKSEASPLFFRFDFLSSDLLVFTDIVMRWGEEVVRL